MSTTPRPTTTYGIRLKDGAISVAREYDHLPTAINEAKVIANDQHRDWEVLEITYHGERDTGPRPREITPRTIRPVARVGHHGRVQALVHGLTYR